MNRWLLISCLFSLFLLALRIILTQRLSYVFLAWNLCLAAVPYSISNWLKSHEQVLKSRIKLIPLVFTWVLFMPNSFYILTDLFHLGTAGNGHSWFDLTLILSFAWNGILFGVLSIRNMEILVRQTRGRLVSGLVICVMMWLNALGVYLGRFLRFNSWDIFLDPFSLCSEIGKILLDPYDHRHVWAMSICFASLMIIIYNTIRKLNEPFKNG